MEKNSENRPAGFKDFRRYHSGAMSHAEQHTFEKRMIDDPMLSEAYEGFLKSIEAKSNHRQIGVDLRNSLENRVSENSTSRFPFVTYAAAASIIVGLGVGWLVFIQTEKVTEPPATANKTFDSEQTIRPKYDVSAPKPAPSTEEQPDKIAPTSAPALARAPKPNGVSVKDAPQIREEHPDLKNFDQIAAVDAAEERVVTAEPVPSAIPSSAPSTLPGRQQSQSAARARESRNNAQFVSGRVVDERGTGLAGASVSADSDGVVTDSLGNFRIPAKSGDSLKLTSAGFASKKLTVRDKNLGEVRLDQSGVQALPQAGWEAYNAYLYKQSVSTQKPGNVTVNFVVSANGSLSKFSAKGPRHLQKKAIEIISNGPAWKPAFSNNAAVDSPVQVQLHFRTSE